MKKPAIEFYVASDNIFADLGLPDADELLLKSSIAITLRRLIAARLALGRRRTFVDATSLTPRERRPYILLARRHGARVRAIFFDVPLATCVARNRARREDGGRRVPLRVMQAMSHKLVPPSRAEGFASITVVRSH